MSALSKLVNGNLKSSKSKSLLIALTIMLTTTLLTSVALTCLNWAKVNKKVTIERSGSFHGIYKRTNIKDLKVIENNIDIEKFGVITTIGYSESNENTLGMIYSDKNSLEMGNVKFIEGGIPTKENEIAVQDGYLNILGIAPKVGEKISLEYEAISNGEVKNYDFVLSGIIESSEFNEASKNYTAVISEEFIKAQKSEKDMIFNAYVRVNGEDKLSGDGIKEKVKTVASDIEINEYDVKINDDYINASNPDLSVIGGGIGIALIVVLSSILVIYSIFYVSVINKVQEHGKLRAIGATKKQIKGIILREGFILATISIPVGILVGWLISDLVIGKMVGMDQYGVGGINIPVIIGIFIVCYLTVFASLIKPIKIASKVSPVEAMRFNGEGNSRKQRVGYEEVTLKRLTFANISRNKKKTAITLSSLALSGILYITMSTIMSSMDAKEMASEHSLGDFTLSLTNYTYNEEGEMPLSKLQDINPLGKELRDKISNLDGIKEIKTDENISAKYMNVHGEETYVRMNGYSDAFVKELEENLVEGKIDEEVLSKGEGIIFTYPSYAEEDGIKVGEKIKFKIYNGNEIIEKEFKVVAISAVYGNEFIFPSSVKDSLITTDVTTDVGITVESNKMKEVEEYLKVLAEGNGFIEFNSLEAEIELYETSLKMMSVLGYSLVIILGVIGFINLINTMITSIITRKKELGMLQAIGLSDKQLIKMLQIEGMFYTFGSLGIILTLGNVIGYIAFMLFKNSGASYASYQYPLTQTIIMIVAITVAQLLITYLVTNSFKKESLVDRVRYSE